MFDMGLHFRFLQKATEAYFEMAQASVAATLAVQARVHDGLTSPSQTMKPEVLPGSWPAWIGAMESGPAAFTMAWSMPVLSTTSVSSRTFYQGPMVAWMLSYGVPYAVAAPTARASTSAMDAADAACAQMRLMFSNDNEALTTSTRRI